MFFSYSIYLDISGSLTCFRSLKIYFFLSGRSFFTQAMEACSRKGKWMEKVTSDGKVQVSQNVNNFSYKKKRFWSCLPETLFPLYPHLAVHLRSEHQPRMDQLWSFFVYCILYFCLTMTYRELQYIFQAWNQFLRSLK